MSTVVVVVLSGGQDSTTCLFWAKKQYPDALLAAVSFNYDQKHKRELECAYALGDIAEVAAHKTIYVGELLGRSPLVNSKSELGQYKHPAELPGGVEPTFVPCRNIVFLTYAANYAMYLADGKEYIDIRLVTGLCEADYGGYPDCRQSFVDNMQQTLNQGLFGHNGNVLTEPRLSGVIQIITPLMNLTKRQTVMLADSLNCIPELSLTHTCYNGTEIPCRQCHACIIRERGFLDAGIPDPLVTKHKLPWPPDWASQLGIQIS